MKRISKTEIKEMRSQSKKNSIMFAFTLPTVILYTIFFLVTMLIGVYYSFTDWNGISKDYTFVGLKNYVKVLTDERFREALWFNIGYTIALVVLLIVIPLTIALALNRIRRLSTLFRSIYFIPAVISMVTVGLIWNELFYRAVPAIGEMLNIEALSTSPLGNPKLAAIAIMVVNIWQGCAIPTVLFIAGLQSVPKDLLEAATIDGAGNWARFWNVIIPYLIPVLNMVIITQAKAGLTVFDYIKVMTNGGPAQSTEAVGGIRDGFPSVMIDGSTKSFQENVELTKNVVRVAKVFGVDVEAELGHVGNGDSIDAIDNTNYYTKVEDAVRFVEQTGCDSLAIAVGNAHGPYVKTPNLDLERIYAIRKKVNIPLVLHGCSDIPEEQMKEAVNLGMSKFNIATEYFRTMYQSIEKRINNQEFEGNGVKLMYDIKEEMIDFVIQKIRLLKGSKR